MTTHQMKLLLAIAIFGALPHFAVAQPADRYGDPLPRGAIARMGTLRLRHDENAYLIGFTDGGKQLLTLGSIPEYDGDKLDSKNRIHVWDVATGKKVRKFGEDDLDGYPPTGLGLSDDGKVLAVGLEAWLVGPLTDTAIQIYDVKQGRQIRSFGQQGRGALTPILSRDGKTIAGYDGRPGQLRRWEIASGKELPRISLATDPERPSPYIAYSSDGKRIAALKGYDLILLSDAENGREVRSIAMPKSPANARVSHILCTALAFAGNTLAVAGNDGAVRLYDPETGKLLRTLRQRNFIHYFKTVVASPDGKILACRRHQSTDIALWDVASGRRLKPLGQPDEGLGNGVAFSPDGRIVAQPMPGGSIRLWNVATGKELAPAPGHHGTISHLGINSDGQRLSTFSESTSHGGDNSIRTWEIAGGRQLKSFQLPPSAGHAELGSSKSGPVADYAALSADGRLLVYRSREPNCTLHIWDVVAAKELRSVAIPTRKDKKYHSQYGMLLSPDGKIAAVEDLYWDDDDDSSVYVRHLIDTSTGRLLLGDGLPAMSFDSWLTFSPDSTLLAAFRLDSAGYRVQFWNVVNRRLVSQLESLSLDHSICSLAFSPDRHTVAAAVEGQVVSIWELVTGKKLIDFKTGPLADWSKMAFSPDGRLLALACQDRIIRVHGAHDGKELAQFAGHRGTIRSLAFAPDGRTLFSGSEDTTALAWDSAAILAQAAPPGSDLNEQEVQALWNDLASQDGNKVYQAITRLSAAPGQAVPLFKQQLKPDPGVPATQIDRLIQDLESNDFKVRQHATDELAKLGSLAEPALKKVLDRQPTLETRQRLEQLLQRSEQRLKSDPNPPPDQFRALRAVSILEQLAIPEAREVLHGLAKGAPGARLTMHAQEAIERLSKRGQ